MRFDGKHVVVTGAASGIGRAAALAFLGEGARVSGLDTAPVSDDIWSTGPCNVGDESEVEQFMNAAVKQSGAVHVLFNNAGVALRRPVAEQSTSEWDRSFEVNVRGIFLCSKFAIPHMSAGSSIVNTASVTGLVGVRNRAAYSATKGAIISMTRNMAVDYAPRGIRVNCVCPGFVRTPLIGGLLADPERAEVVRALHPLGRLGEPEDIAKAVLFLASEDASWITGQAIAVDGGFSAGYSADI